MDDYETLRRWRNNIPNLHNGSYRRTWAKAVAKESMRAAVNAKCQDCMAWQGAEVRKCDVITCPLWQYRPLQDKGQFRGKSVRKLVGEIIAAKTSSTPRTPSVALL